MLHEHKQEHIMSKSIPTRKENTTHVSDAIDVTPISVCSRSKMKLINSLCVGSMHANCPASSVQYKMFHKTCYFMIDNGAIRSSKYISGLCFVPQVCS